MTTVVIQSFPGPGFGLHIVELRKWCRAQKLAIVNLRCKLKSETGGCPEMHVECRTAEEANLLAEAFSSRARVAGQGADACAEAGWMSAA